MQDTQIVSCFLGILGGRCPQHQDVDALICLAIGAQWPVKLATFPSGFPRLHPRPDSKFQIFDDGISHGPVNGMRALIAQVGKPFAEARSEVATSADFFEWAAEEACRLRNYSLSGYVPGNVATVRYRPIGPVLALTPWNFPFNLPTRKIAMALAAGCPVILRPAEQAPGSASALIRCCLDGGVPDDAISLLLGPPEATVLPIMNDPRIRAVSFTGSTAVGKRLIAKSAATVKRLCLSWEDMRPSWCCPTPT